MNDNITTLLKSLYKSLSNLIPKKIEWMVKAIAEAIPKNTIFFIFLWLVSKWLMISLLNNQYFINKKDVKNIAGLNINHEGYGLAVLLIDAPPSI